MCRRPQDRGAAAVEFALVVPILIALVVAIAAFGRAYNIQSGLSMAAREGVRSMALDQKSTAVATAENLAISEANALIGVTSGVGASVSPATSPCAAGVNVTMTVTYTFDFFGFGGFLGILETVNMNGKGVMRCGG